MKKSEEPRFVFNLNLARALNEDLLKRQQEENDVKCAALKSQLPRYMLQAIHPGEVSEVNKNLSEMDLSSCAKNQNYVKGGLIYMPATNLQFERFLKRSRGPVVIDFYARWLSEAIKKEKGTVKVVRVNVSKLPTIADRFNVSVTPTAVGIGCDGSEINRLMGATDETNIRNFVKDIVKSCKNKKRSISADRYESQSMGDESQVRFKGKTAGIKRPIHLYERAKKRSLSEIRPMRNVKGGDFNETHKHFFFTNESVSSKPLTMIPGIGRVYAARMEAHGIKSAKQLVGIYMQDRNMVAFQHFLKETFNMNERWARIATEAIEQVVRHMV